MESWLDAGILVRMRSRVSVAGPRRCAPFRLRRERVTHTVALSACCPRPRRAASRERARKETSSPGIGPRGLK